MGLLPYKNEPYLDFTTDENRRALDEAFKQVEGQLGKSYPLRIGEQRLDTDGEIVSVNPSNPSQVIGRTASATEREADMALATATKTFESWSRTTAEYRARIMLRASGIMRRRKLELIGWEVYESGKVPSEAVAHVAEAIDFLEYYAREMLRLKDGAPVHSLPGEESRYFYQPMGVGVVIAPWNFPLAILTGMSSAAMVTGNTVVLKPSESTSVIAAIYADIMQEAGLPEGVMSYLPGYGSDMGDYLVSDPRTRFISFTGSMQTGLRINELAAKPNGQPWIKRVLAEMGGKDAMIVDDSADLDAAAHDIVTSAYGYGGQKCSAASRAILHEKIYDRVLEKVVEQTKNLNQGQPTEPGMDLGPVINHGQFEKISGYIDTGKGEGELLAGGDVTDPDSGYFVSPTILGVDPRATVAREEIFGPVLSVMKANSFENALEIANDSPYGLTGGVYSKNREHLEIARHEYQAGNVYFNRTITGSLVGVQPFGGFGMSGTDSKAGGPDYLPQHMLPRTVVERF
jgi:1-pyrroline-5-carboxylate dehydrogenase